MTAHLDLEALEEGLVGDVRAGLKLQLGQHVCAAEVSDTNQILGSLSLSLSLASHVSAFSHLLFSSRIPPFVWLSPSLSLSLSLL